MSLERSASRSRIAVLLSGRGSNFEAIADAIVSGRIPDAEIVAVISDVPSAKGLSSARDRDLPAHSVDRREFANRAEFEARLLTILDAALPDLICLAGFMRVLSPEFIARWKGRVLNIHPSLLPKFPGLEPQRRAIEAGETVSGCTVHVVDEGVDSGPILLQKRVLVRPEDTPDTLAVRILEAEHQAYPEAIAQFLMAPRKGP